MTSIGHFGASDDWTANSHFGPVSTLARDIWYLTLWTERHFGSALLGPLHFGPCTLWPKTFWPVTFWLLTFGTKWHNGLSWFCLGQFGPVTFRPKTFWPQTFWLQTFRPDILAPDILAKDISAPDILAQDIFAPDISATSKLYPFYYALYAQCLEWIIETILHPW